MIKQRISSFLLLFSLFFLLYVFYKSEIFWEGNKRNYYLIYYFISILLIFYSVILFFVGKKIREYLLISTLSVIFALYLSEGYITIQDLSNSNLKINKEKRKKIKIYEKTTGKKYDQRTQSEIYKDLKKKDNKITISYLPYSNIKKKNDFFPLSGVSNIKTIMCNENGYYAIYNSDRYGFNNPDKEWDQSEIEYLLVGDSYLQGYCVNRPNDMTSVLRKLSNKSALNLGLGGNGPLIQYAGLREYLKPKVKKIIWIYFEGNDIENLSKELDNPILNKYLTDYNHSQRLLFKQKKIDLYAQKFIDKAVNEAKSPEFNFLYFIKLSKIRGILNKFLPEKNQPQRNVIQIPKEFIEVLKQAQSLAIENNSKIYFVYLPHDNRFFEDYDDTNYFLVKKIVKELKIDFIDIKEIFENEKDPMLYYPFEIGGHLNEKGYNRVANIIFDNTKD